MQPVCKPGSVLLNQKLKLKVFAIYLRLPSPTGSSDLPPDIGRAILHTPVYMVLQPARGTAHDIATATGGLLPRLFTLTRLFPHGRLFSVTLALPSRIASTLRSAVLCVARTFLFHPPEGGCQRQTNLLHRCKGKLI
ncbi:hypothetical protein M2132_001541 [Dysgonomonas sp. PH5-45]|nr:hypothetical protein [Dysgonomonas sp. PH5-45]MDH6388070.1 hypothetical protein [Dysgonomonas sp. PH5-37]